MVNEMLNAVLLRGVMSVTFGAKLSRTKKVMLSEELRLSELSFARMVML